MFVIPYLYLKRSSFFHLLKLLLTESLSVSDNYNHIENDYSVKLTQKATVCHHNKAANEEKPLQSNEIIYISCKIIGSMYFLYGLC